MKRAVAYCRFSSSNQREESIDAQIRAIKEYCDKNKLKLRNTSQVWIFNRKNELQ